MSSLIDGCVHMSKKMSLGLGEICDFKMRS